MQKNVGRFFDDRSDGSPSVVQKIPAYGWMDLLYVAPMSYNLYYTPE